MIQKSIAILFVIGLLATGCAASGHSPHSRRNAKATTGAAAVTLPTVRCSDVDPTFQPIVKDINSQDKLFRTMSHGPKALRLPLETRDDMAAGAWTPPGTYSNDLGSFTSYGLGVYANYPAVPSSLSADVVTLVEAGEALQNDMNNGGVTFGQPIPQDWYNFEGAVLALANDCKLHVSKPWGL
jgi:hypothetical protein